MASTRRHSTEKRNVIATSRDSAAAGAVQPLKRLAIREVGNWPLLSTVHPVHLSPGVICPNKRCHFSECKGLYLVDFQRATRYSKSWNIIPNNRMDKTLIKGVQLLDCLVRAEGPCSIGELARLSGLNSSNVHRTLQTWSHLGFVAQDPASGAYHCTLQLFEWGCRVADGFDVRAAARDHLARLAADTQETIHLSVLDGSEIVYLDKIDSPQPVRAYSKIGGRAPAHCVATGKALLAHASPSVLAALPSPLPAPTQNTVADLNALRMQLTEVRNRGYAVNHEEWRMGVSGLGAPVFAQSGQAIAAVGLTAPSARLQPPAEHQLAMKVVAAAEAISKALAPGLRKLAA